MESNKYTDDNRSKKAGNSLNECPGVRAVSKVKNSFLRPIFIARPCGESKSFYVIIVASVLALSGCQSMPQDILDLVGSIPKISKTENVLAKGSNINIRYGNEQVYIAADLANVVEELVQQVPWAYNILEEHDMFFEFSKGNELASYSPSNPNIITINPEFRAMANFYRLRNKSTIKGPNYDIKQSILEELVRKEQDASGLMKMIENLKPSDYCVIANFMEIDAKFKSTATLIQVNAESRDELLPQMCRRWKYYESYTRANMDRQSYRPDGRNTTLWQCFLMAGKCGPFEAGYSEDALKLAKMAVQSGTWGDRMSGSRMTRFKIQEADERFYAAQKSR